MSENMNDNMNNNNDEVYESASGFTKEEIAEIKKKSRANQMRRSKFIIGIASAVLGLVLLFWPGLTMELICQFVGAALCVIGVLTSAVFFTQPEGTPMRGASLVFGIPVVLLGLFIFLRPSMIIEFIPVLIGFIILLNGVTDLFESISMMKQGYSRWWITLLTAIVTIVLGIVLIMRPFSAARTFMRVIGAVILYNGLSDIFIASKIRSTIKDI